MHPFSLFSASKAPEKWLYDAICRKKQLFPTSRSGFLILHECLQLYKEPADERLVENETRAMRIVGGLFALLSFLLLFLLDRQGIGRDTVLLFGALGYSVCSVAAPALTYYLDRKA